MCGMYLYLSIYIYATSFYSFTHYTNNNIKYNYIYLILKEENSKVPFAVKKYKNSDLPKYLSIDATNKMIKNSSIPKEVKLYIKGSDQPSVSKKMVEIYESDMLDLSRSNEYVIN